MTLCDKYGCYHWSVVVYSLLGSSVYYLCQGYILLALVCLYVAGLRKEKKMGRGVTRSREILSPVVGIRFVKDGTKTKILFGMSSGRHEVMGKQ